MRRGVGSSNYYQVLLANKANDTSEERRRLLMVVLVGENFLLGCVFLKKKLIKCYFKNLNPLGNIFPVIE